MGLSTLTRECIPPPGGEGGCPAKLVYLREKSYIFSVLKDITFSQKLQLYLVYLTYLVYLRKGICVFKSVFFSCLKHIEFVGSKKFRRLTAAIYNMIRILCQDII